VRTDAGEERDLHAYVDGQLEPAARAATATRLAADRAVRERADAYAAGRGLLREGWEGMADAPEDPRTAALTEELARRLEARRAEAARPPWRRLRAALLPAALAVSAALGWFAHDVWVPAPSAAAPTSASVPTNLSPAIQVPSLADLGMRFVGGNITDTPEGVLAYFTYLDASGARVSLAISPYPHEGSTRPVVTERDGVRQAHWSGALRSYVVTTTSRDVRVDAIAASLIVQENRRAP
jgi:anti-sigma factor RsiW